MKNITFGVGGMGGVMWSLPPAPETFLFMLVVAVNDYRILVSTAIRCKLAAVATGIKRTHRAERVAAYNASV